MAKTQTRNRELV